MGSLRNRLGLLSLAITLGAIAVVYGGVMPRLESSLRDEALRALAQTARRFGPEIGHAVNSNATAPKIDGLVRDSADASNSRVTLFGVFSGTEGLTTFLKSDSTREVAIADLRFPVARTAARSGRVATGAEAAGGGRIGQAALPLYSRDPDSGRRVVGSVVVFSAPLDATAGEVAVIRERLLVAALVALAAATFAGYLVAGWLTRRVHRLEVAARRVAAGDFDAHFAVDSDDELGQLARALDDMERQLAELDSARKRFIATASHELRTPIFSLGGFVELLEDGDVEEEDRRRFLAQLRTQVARLGKLATDLLDLSKLDAGAVVIRREQTDLGALVGVVASEFAPAAAVRATNVELRMPREPIELVCDPDRVAQVMRILLDNALTHTPPGTDVAVSASRAGECVRISVSDSGPGVDPALLARIFEPFVTSDDAQGSGLGLAIAHELAERMGGRLALDSDAGRTTFTLELSA